MKEIEGYINMLDKKGDREGLKQALKAKAEAGKRNSDYISAKKLESKAQDTFKQFKPNQGVLTDQEKDRYEGGRAPQSDESLSEKVSKEYDRAKYPDIMDSKTDPRIKRMELREKVKSLSDYTKGKLESSDKKFEGIEEGDEDDEYLKDFLKSSRKRVGN